MHNSRPMAGISVNEFLTAELDQIAYSTDLPIEQSAIVSMHIMYTDENSWNRSDPQVPFAWLISPKLTWPIQM